MHYNKLKKNYILVCIISTILLLYYIKYPHKELDRFLAEEYKVLYSALIYIKIILNIVLIMNVKYIIAELFFV